MGSVQADGGLVLKVMQDITDSDWDVVVGALNGSMFHRAAWLRAVQAGLDLELVKLGIYRGGKFIGVFPFFQKRVCGLRIAGSPLYVETVPALGPVGDFDVNEFLTAISSYLKRKKIRYMRIFFNSCLDLSPAVAGKVKCIEKKTHINQLTVGKEKVWENLRSLAKKNIKKAEKSNLEIIHDDNFAFLPEYLKLVQELYHRQGLKSPKPVKLYEQLYSESNRNNIKVMFVTHNGTVIGGIILALSKSMVNAIDTAILSEFKHTQSGTYIFWKAMEWCLENGYDNFDFTGSDIERLAQFKANFGGTLTKYACIEIANPALIFEARELYTKSKYRFNRAAYKAECIRDSIWAWAEVRPFFSRIYNKMSAAIASLRSDNAAKRPAKRMADTRPGLDTPN